jgi:hypothetical protein
MYISKPNEIQIATVKAWIQEHRSKFDYGNEFDMAVDCSYDLDIFDKDQHLIDGSEFTIPSWIVDLCKQFFEKK